MLYQKEFVILPLCEEYGKHLNKESEKLSLLYCLIFGF